MSGNRTVVTSVSSSSSSNSEENYCDNRLLNWFGCHHNRNKTKAVVSTSTPSPLSTSSSLTTITPRIPDELFATLPTLSLVAAAAAAQGTEPSTSVASVPFSDAVEDINLNKCTGSAMRYIQQNIKHLSSNGHYPHQKDHLLDLFPPHQPPNSEFYIEEKINSNVYQSSNLIHQICYGNSYFGDTLFNDVCFNCNQTILTPLLDLSMYDNIQTQCGDCGRRLCNECIAIGNTNVCYCFLFRVDTGCDKILCTHCSMVIKKPLNVLNGIDDKSYISQSEKNTTYSFKCFFELLKQLFTNETLDRGPANALIRIINNFDNTNILPGQDLISVGIETILRDNEYPKTLAIVCFELAKAELLELEKSIL